MSIVFINVGASWMDSQGHPNTQLEDKTVEAPRLLTMI